MLHTVSKAKSGDALQANGDGDQERQRSVRLPDKVWYALDADAERCKRSATKQLEAILSVYYDIDSVELRDMASTRAVASPYLAEVTRSEEIDYAALSDFARTLSPGRRDAFEQAIKSFMSYESQKDSTNGADTSEPDRRRLPA